MEREKNFLMQYDPNFGKTRIIISDLRCYQKYEAAVIFGYLI